MFNLTVDEINFYSFLAFPLLLHRLLLRRLRPFEGSGCFYRSMKYHAMNIYTRINLAVLFLAVASLLIQVYVHSDDFTKTAIGIPNAISAILIVSKGSVTFFQRKRIWAIIQEVKFVHESKSKANVKESVKAHLDFYHRVSKVYAGICFFLFLPVVLPIFQFILFDEMKLTTEYWYPFDEYSRENYLFAFVWLVYVTANYLITLVASDILLFALITLIVLELDILRIDFEELRTISNASRARKLKELISHHERVLEICDKLQDIYGPTFLISFVISSLVICFVAFQLSTNSSDTEAVVFFIPYLGMIAGQVYLKCKFHLIFHLEKYSLIIAHDRCLWPASNQLKLVCCSGSFRKRLGEDGRQ